MKQNARRSMLSVIWLTMLLAMTFLLVAGCTTSPTTRDDSGVAGSGSATGVESPAAMPEPTHEQPTSGISTPAAPSLNETGASGDTLPEGVSYYLIRDVTAPDAIPAETEWTVDRMEVLYPGNRWVLLYEQGRLPAREGTGGFVSAQRIRIEDNVTRSPVAILDFLVPDGLPSQVLAHTGTMRGQRGPDGGEPTIERLYFGISSSGDGCGLYAAQIGLYEVTLPSGQITERLALDWSATVVGASPDGQKVAYVPWSGTPTLVVRQLDGGGEQRIPLMEAAESQADSQTGDYTWSPQSDAIAFATVRGICNGEPPSTMIRIARLDDGSVTELMTDPQRFLHIEAWPLDQRIQMSDRATYWLNSETGEVRNDPN